MIKVKLQIRRGLALTPLSGKSMQLAMESTD